MKIFDYLFFRIYNFYKKKKDSTPVFMGCLVLSLMCCLTLLSFLTLLSCFGDILELNAVVLKSTMLLVVLPLPFIWKIRYDKKDLLLEIELRFQNEPIKNKRVHGWLFSAYLVIIILIPISIGYMRHNLGMNI